MEENKEEKVVNSENVRPSEVVLSFMSWLRSRSQLVTIGQGCSGKISLIDRFITSQGWEQPRVNCRQYFLDFPEEETLEQFKGIIESNKLNHRSGTDPGVLARHLISCLENYESTQIRASKKG